MQRICGILICAIIFCASGSVAGAQAKVADTVCPSAVPPLKSLGAVTDPTDAVKIADAARGVVRAYADCIVEARSDGAVEPNMHYDEIRAAQYDILLGRALMVQKDYDGAHAAFADARKLSGDVVDWVPQPIGYNMNNKLGSGTVKNSGYTKSQYYDSAADIVKAADTELAKLEPATDKKQAPASPSP